MQDAGLGHDDTQDLFGYKRWYPLKAIERLRTIRKEVLLRLPDGANVTFQDPGTAGLVVNLWHLERPLGNVREVRIAREVVGMAAKPLLVHHANTAYTLADAVNMTVAAWPAGHEASAAEAHRLLGDYMDRHGSD